MTPVISTKENVPGQVAAEIEMGLATRITVKPGSSWSDGTPITAADITRTWKLVRAAKVPFEGYASVKEIRDDGDSIVMTIDPRSGARFDQGYRVLPPGFDAATYAKAWPVSGGPFLLKKWTAGSGLAYEANGTAPGGTPKLAGLSVDFVTDPDSALALFKRGDLDVVTRYGAPAWRERLTAAGAQQSLPGAGRTFALVLRSPKTKTARERMLARIDLARINTVLVQSEAAFGCHDAKPWPQCYRGKLPAAGPRVGTLTLGFLASDALAGRIAVALRQMLGPLRLQPRSSADLASHISDIDLMLLTAPGRDDLTTLDAIGSGPEPRRFVFFVATETLGARIELERPGIAGPFEGAALWPSTIARP